MTNKAQQADIPKATLEALMAQVAALTQDLAASKLANTPKPKASRIIKSNKSNGIYIMDTSFQAFSELKNKSYTAGINIQKHQVDFFHKIFSNPEFCKQIAEAIQTGVEFRA